MPPQPQIRGSIESELTNSQGAGRWGLDFAICGEIAIFKMNRERVQSQCVSYFENREREAKSAVFPFDLDQALNKNREIKRTLFVQFLFVLTPGLLIPFVIAVLKWRRERPSKFPKRFANILIGASLFGVFVGYWGSIATGNFKQAISLVGGGPAASIGATIAFLVLIPLYWIGLFLIYRFFKLKSTGSSTLKE